MTPFLFLLSCGMLRQKGLHFYLVIGLFAIYLVNGFIAIPRNSVTYDEMDHWSYGKRILMRKTDKIFPYDDAGISPFHGINAIPRAVQQVISPDLRKTDGGFSDIMQGRYVSLFICILIGYFIYLWSRKLFGENAGLLSLFMFVFCPNLNGHAILFTGDAYTALFLMTTLFSFWKFVKVSKQKYFLLFALSFAIAQTIKYSLIHLFVIIGILSLIILIQRRSLISNWKKNLSRLFVFLLIQLFVINAAFLFNGSGQKLKDYHFHSSLFQSIQSSTALSAIPLPLPVPYVEGFDVTYHMMELGAGHPLVSSKNYILGETRIHEGFWYYYFVVLFFKTPIPYLLLLLLASWLFLKKRKLAVDSAGFIIGFSALCLLLVFSFFNEVQIGIRHMLLLYPMLYVLAGKVSEIDWKNRTKKFLFAAFAIYSLVTFYFYYPNLISYSNELIPIKKNAYKVMAESNIDYGQCWYALEEYMQSHPDVRIIGDKPEPGKFVIGINDYLDLDDKHKYYWLYKLKPSKHIDHCFLQFNVMPWDINTKTPQ